MLEIHLISNMNNKLSFLKNIIQNTENIFFDFDGVIVESLDIKGEGFTELYKDINNKDLNEIIKHHNYYSGVSRFEKIKYYHKKYYNIKLNKEQLVIQCNKYSKIILKKMMNVPYVKGAKEFLELSRKINKIFLLSATPQGELEEILKFKKINNYFIEVCGSPKKKDFHLRKIIKQNNINIDKSIFFGDSVNDYLVSKKFKINFVLRQHNLNAEIFDKINCERIINFIL